MHPEVRQGPQRGLEPARSSRAPGGHGRQKLRPPSPRAAGRRSEPRAARLAVADQGVFSLRSPGTALAVQPALPSGHHSPRAVAGLQCQSEIVHARRHQMPPKWLPPVPGRTGRHLKHRHRRRGPPGEEAPRDSADCARRKARRRPRAGARVRQRGRRHPPLPAGPSPSRDHMLAAAQPVLQSDSPRWLRREDSTLEQSTEQFRAPSNSGSRGRAPREVRRQCSKHHPQ